MQHKAITIILLLFISAVFSSCTKTDINSSGSIDHSTVISGVPFVKQKYQLCGPAALTSVLRYYGSETNQDEIARVVYTPELKGSLISDMKHYAGENGFNASTQNGDLESLIKLIEETNR